MNSLDEALKIRDQIVRWRRDLHRIPEIQSGVSAIISITNISGSLGTYNVIPDKVEMMGEIRVRYRETQEFLFRRVREVVEGICASKSAVGTEDAAYLFEKVPSCYFFLSNAVPCGGVVYPHHNGRFRIDDTVLYQGSALMEPYDPVGNAGQVSGLLLGAEPENMTWRRNQQRESNKKNQ